MAYLHAARPSVPSMPFNIPDAMSAPKALLMMLHSKGSQFGVPAQCVCTTLKWEIMPRAPAREECGFDQAKEACEECPYETEVTSVTSRSGIYSQEVLTFSQSLGN